MEHKLIQGGEKYLPFARSRIKALRATGLKYASQQFEIDEFSVKVRIEGEQEYISISGESCAIGMDSGVVDVLAYGDKTQHYLPGVLHETTTSRAYNAPFVLPRPGATWRQNPNKSSAGQFSGYIQGGETFQGKILADRGRPLSFTPGTKESHATAETTWVADLEDKNLEAKKFTAALCPASIFTGRCRLYVQAMYGRFMYTPAVPAENTKSSLDGPIPSVIADGFIPRLTLTAYKRPEDKGISYPEVNIDTSSGVYLDSATGNHWLFVVGSQVDIYPLRAYGCRETLRHHLITTPIGGAKASTLSDEDRKHLESFILSACLPDVKNKQTVTPKKVETSGAMGYGWHWNWSGTKADIVSVGGGMLAGNQVMVSTHSRLTMALADGVWSGATSTVEGPSNWNVDRHSWIIAAPVWIYRRLLKQTPAIPFPVLIECDAPIYVFYSGDELKVCRVSVTKINGSPGTRTMSPNYSSSAAYGTSVEKYTLGMKDGFHEDRLGGIASFTAAFTCGSYTTGPLPLSKQSTGSGSSVFGKSQIEMYGPVYGNGSGVYQTFRTGEQLALNGPWQLAGVGGGVVWNDSYQGRFTFSTKSYTFQDIESGQAVIVVPFNDSEAIYMHHEYHTLRTKTELSYQTAAPTLKGEWSGRAYVYSPVGFGPYDYTGWGDTYSANGTTLLSNVSTVADTVTNTDSLVCHAGVLSAKFTGLSDFFDFYFESVSVNFPTLSSTGIGNDAVVMAPENLVKAYGVDNKGAAAVAPVLVGWV